VFEYTLLPTRLLILFYVKHTTPHKVKCVRKVQSVRKVAVHLGYGTYIWLSVSKLPLQCAVVSLHSVVKQRLTCDTGKVCSCLIQL
jgi:hypothetical protein